LGRWICFEIELYQMKGPDLFLYLLFKFKLIHNVRLSSRFAYVYQDLNSCFKGRAVISRWLSLWPLRWDLCWWMFPANRASSLWSEKTDDITYPQEVFLWKVIENPYGNWSCTPVPFGMNQYSSVPEFLYFQICSNRPKFQGIDVQMCIVLMPWSWITMRLIDYDP
jgi:hypothetical protein